MGVDTKIDTQVSKMSEEFLDTRTHES